MKKEKMKAHSLTIQPSLMDEIKKSALKNSDGNVNFEIRRLIKKALENERVN